MSSYTTLQMTVIIISMLTYNNWAMANLHIIYDMQPWEAQELYKIYLRKKLWFVSDIL